MAEKVVSPPITPKDAQVSYESEQVPLPDMSEAELVSFGNDRVDDKPEVESPIHIPKVNTVRPEFVQVNPFGYPTIATTNYNTPKTIGHNFWLHEFQLNKLAKIGELIRGARKAGSVSDSGNRVKVICGGDGVDFYDTFRVLYSPAILGVPEFEVDTLVSALRIASAYDYADLRKTLQSTSSKNTPFLLLIKQSSRTIFFSRIGRSRPSLNSVIALNL
ncbi:hypothetical protein V565_043290 [Rhizoctonia solani 123E]|uniref:Uncharacterized protein n=1 Tax=Rhizoctonia solani 123E TaxID=1423351 RepID=A0A074RZX2_9AGAM|nr:hypothetical protein V565_043290 [Rhizoctonia solani 123E]